MIEERKRKKKENTGLNTFHSPGIVKYLPGKAFSTAEEQKVNRTTKCSVRNLQIFQTK
jgi:hypothetical protein